MHLGAVGEVLFYEAAKLTDVFFRVVVAGNGRDAHPDVAGTFAAQMSQVLQNTGVALTGTLAVLRIVHVLDVVEYDIAELSRAAQNLPGDSAAGFDGTVGMPSSRQSCSRASVNSGCARASPPVMVTPPSSP